MSGIYLPNFQGHGNFPYLSGVIPGDWTPPVSKDLKAQIEKCVDDEAMFAAIEDEAEKYDIQWCSAGVSGQTVYASGLCSSVFQGSGYIQNNLQWLIPYLKEHDESLLE